MVVGETKLEVPVTAAEVARILGGWKRGEVPIEEQDHSRYIIHFPEWVTVNGSSPLFQNLRQAHEEFLENRAKG